MKKPLLLFSLLFLKSISLWASCDSLKVKAPAPVVSYLYESQYTEQDSVTYTNIDTSLKKVYVYNPVYKSDFAYRFLGNLSSAAQPIRFSAFKSPWTQPGFSQLDIYTYKGDAIRYYNARKRYTELYYISGSKKEQVLELTHSQNITRNLNMGFNLRRMYIEGQLLQQDTYSNNLDGFLKYSSDDRKYTVLANVVYNKILNSENGGLQSDSLYEKGSRLTRAVPVNLESAFTRWIQKSVQVIQFYDTRKDSGFVYHRDAFFRFSHSISYQKKSYVYEDQGLTRLDGSTYYRAFYINPKQTLDSTSFSTLSTQFGITGFAPASRITGYLRFEGINYSQYSYDTLSAVKFGASNYANLYAGGEFGQRIWKTFQFRVSGIYGVSGYNAQDYLVKASLEKSGSACVAGLRAATQLRSPDLMIQHYHSNNFMWDNAFGKTNTSSAGAFATLPAWKAALSADYSIIDGYIGYNGLAMPFQTMKRIGLVQVSFSKNFALGRWRFDNNVLYQFTSSGLIRLPDLVSNHSLYYTDNFFNSALFAQMGTNVRYNSAYYGDAYMPATGQFYLQGDKLIGNYAVVDLFFSFKVKSARLFLIAEHLNKGLSSRSYYEVPGYPMPGRIIKFGLSWRFYD